MLPLLASQIVELLPSPFFPRFQQFIETLETSCLICSPFITSGPVKRMVEVVERKGLRNTLRVKVVTDISAGNLLSGATDVSALLQLAERVRNVQIVYLPRIHAKVYISGSTLALISSANFTDGGAFANLEYGVALRDSTHIQQIETDINQYAELGAPVAKERLVDLQDRVVNLRKAVHEEQRTINRRVRELSEELRRNTEEELIRVRVQGRAVHGIFAETIFYLLSRSPMNTVELHTYVQQIHPDLCDDTTDRVIDGQHFGKLWKHQVRTAQQNLKRRRLISYDSHSRTWSRIA